MKLVDGQTPSDGRIQVCVDGLWGSVCDSMWDSRDAVVLCRQLQYNGCEFEIVAFIRTNIILSYQHHIPCMGI